MDTNWYLENKNEIDYELLTILEKVIEEHKLNGHMAFGSLIGAIRHKGFIPWDDDVDYAFDLKQRECLREILRKFCEDNPRYYFQETQGTGLDLFEPDYFGIKQVVRFDHKQLQRVTPISLSTKIDIFYYAQFNDEDFNHYQKLYKKYNLLSSSLRMRNTKGVKDLILKLVRLTYNNIYNQIKSFEKKLISNSNQKTYYLDERIKNGQKLPIEGDFDIIKAKFGNTFVSVPKDYDKILKLQYNDYMEFPPVEKQVPIHTITYFDPKCDEKYLGKEDSCVSKIVATHSNFDFTTIILNGDFIITESNVEYEVFESYNQIDKKIFISGDCDVKIVFNSVENYSYKMSFKNKNIIFNVENNILTIKYLQR